MISWLKAQFRRRSHTVENPYFKKVERILGSIKSISGYNKIYFLGGFEYSQASYSALRVAIEKDTLVDFFKGVSYNTQSDNVELYLIEAIDSFYILCVLDHLELLAGDQLLDVVKSPGINFEGLSCEQVYP